MRRMRRLLKTVGTATMVLAICASPVLGQEAQEVGEQAVAGQNQETSINPTQGTLTAVSLPPINVYGVAEQSPAVPVTTRFGTQFNAVSEEQIKRQGSLDFLDALRNVPGVSYQKRNIIGGQTSHSLYIRGRGASHPSPDLNIYFDDVPRSGVLYGQTLADGIPVYAIGGMEVYKYPQPSRFGSGYGMINFVPKYMVEEGKEFRVGFAAGSYGTFAENTAFGIKNGGFDVYAAQSWISSDGHGNHSRAQQASYYVNMGFQPSEHWTIRLMANYVDSQTLHPFYSNGERRERSGTYADRYDTETGLTTLTLSNQFDNASGYVKFYYNDTNFYLVDESNAVSTSKQANTLSGVRVRETFSLWDGNEFVAGFDLDKTDLVNSNTNHNTGLYRVWNFPDQTLFSPYAAISQYFGSEDGFHAVPSAGIRLYRHSLFKDKTSPQAGLVIGYGHTDLNFNYAKGVNYPSPVILQGFLQDKSLPADFTTDDIKPEVVDHYEVGLTHTWPGMAALSGTWYYDEGKDRTRAYMYGGAPDTSFFNSRVSRYKIRGFELSGSLTPVEDLEFFAGATWLKAKATGDDGIERDKMPYTPDFTLQAGFSWRFLDNFRLSGDYQHLQGIYDGTLMRTSGTGAPGSNFPALTDASKLDDINVVNLRLGYTFDYEPWNLSEAEIYLNVNNVFNADYAYKLDGYGRPYEMPGTTFMAGVDFKFN